MKIYERWIWDSGGDVRLEKKSGSIDHAAIEVNMENAKKIIGRLEKLVDEFYNLPYCEVITFIEDSEREVKYIRDDIGLIKEKFVIL